MFAQSEKYPIYIGNNLEKSLFLEDIALLTNTDLPIDKLDLKNNWEEYALSDKTTKRLNELQGVNWLYRKIKATDNLEFDKEISLRLINIGDYIEVYLDNHLIGKRTNEHILSRTVIQQVKLPFDLLSPGGHNLLIKFVNSPDGYKRNFSSLEIGYDRNFIKRQIEYNYSVIVFTTLLYLLALYFFLMFIGFKKDINYLLIALFVLCNAIKSTITPMWIIQNAQMIISPYDSTTSVIFYNTSIVALIAFYLLKFDLFKKMKIISLILMSIPFLTLYVYGPVRQVAFFIFIFIVTVYSIYHKKQGSWFVFVAGFLLGLTSILRHYQIMQQGYFIGVILFAVVMLFETAYEISTQIKLRREAGLRSARLENELLKRNIQPHFILNTLTALQEVVEQNQKQAVKLIQSLADEFRLFSKVSDKKLISISDELEICSAHLQIMEYRKDACFTLTTENIDGNELIPPGIFHTIVENGTTHGFASQMNGEFTITKIVNDNFTSYEIFNNGQNKSEKNKPGNGLKYVETRLEESFPDKWKLTSEPMENGWKVTIIICE